jgi:hypothetical protein
MPRVESTLDLSPAVDPSPLGLGRRLCLIHFAGRSSESIVISDPVGAPSGYLRGTILGNIVFAPRNNYLFQAKTRKSLRLGWGGKLRESLAVRRRPIIFDLGA